MIAQISLIEEKIRGEAQQIMDAKYNPRTKIGKAIFAKMIAVVKVSIKKLE